MVKITPKPLTLIVLDGWGYSEAKTDNAILSAKTPHWDKLWETYPHGLISGSGKDVGLPAGQMGNSEVGHLNLGAGRVVKQKYAEITQSIDDGSFYDNKTLTNAVKKASEKNKAVHVLGLLSPGGVHSHEKHIKAMLHLAKKQGATKIFLHAFLDGRDTPPKSAQASIEAMENTFAELGVGQFASIIGRYYAMDRDQRWDRIQKAYDLLTAGEYDFSATSATEALTAAYDRGETDEFVKATAIFQPSEKAHAIEDGDAVIFMNFRADRARQLTRAFTDKAAPFAQKQKPTLSSFVMLTEYAADIEAECAFPPTQLTNIFGEVIAQNGLTQLRIAETEKYAHVTFFFNGGVETPFQNEERVLVPSPDVATYDLQPEMSAPIVCDKLVEAINQQAYDTIICNFANPDMVGHTGNFDATVKAIETIDDAIGKIVKASLSVGGEVIITADHGNAEKMRDTKTQQQHTAHTSEPVPFLYIGRPAKLTTTNGKLSDIAPTMLYLMEIDKPQEMTGVSLLELL